MKREYTSGTSEDVTFFIGTEIERTPAFGMRTLFVVGTHDPQIILHIADDTQSLLDESKRIKHIYFGANQSFKTNGVNDAEGWRPWEYMIEQCLKAGYWCTLDFDVSEHEGLLESGLTEHRRFIPQISVKLPYLAQLGYNATIKIDDKDFEATNPGVWCIPIGAITQRKYFTNWDEYTNDEIIK
jgi:hypothetical protein